MSSQLYALPRHERVPWLTAQLQSTTPTAIWCRRPQSWDVILRVQDVGSQVSKTLQRGRTSEYINLGSASDVMALLVTMIASLHIGVELSGIEVDNWAHGSHRKELSCRWCELKRFQAGQSPYINQCFLGLCSFNSCLRSASSRWRCCLALVY